MGPLATTTHGRLRGLDRDDHLAFLGVPYAQPPIGQRRFTAPEPPTPWSDVRDALAFGDAAPQDPFVPASFRATVPESEDCLSLNVYTPGLDDRRRPVLFWIHGGGFSHGSGSQAAYNGGPLAARGDVVVVTINYRVGALGYLYLGDHGGADWGAGTNVGQLDQIAALQWVNHNIERFGGDPDNVTIFGQSAGGVAVSTLLAMPAANVLFHRAIAQSGTANRLGDTTYASAATSRFLDRLGIPDADPVKLRAAEIPDLLNAQGPRGPLSPVIDGDSLPRHPLHAVRDGDASHITLMVGTARDEQKLYVAPDRPEIDDVELERQAREHLPRRAAERAGEVIALYRESRSSRGLPATGNDTSDAIATASRFRYPATQLAEAQAAHQPRTFLYQVDWESPARRGALGACHAIEIPFVFGTVGKTGNDRMSGTGPDADRLAEQMMDAWIGFARTGDPSHDGIGPWPAYDTNERHTMIFGRRCGVESAPFEEERAVWDSMVGLRAR